MRRILLASVVVLWTSSATSSLFAQGGGSLTGITVTPFPLCVGDNVTYAATHQGMPPFSYSWQWRCEHGGMVGLWFSFGMNNSGFGTFESRVGSKEIKCTGNWTPGGPSTVTTNITVHGPDHDEIIEGLGTNSNGFPLMQVIVKFQLYCGSHECGSAIDGKAQERIRKPQKGEDSGWVDESDMFELRLSTIWDTKAFAPLSPEGQAQWDGTLAGQPFDDFWQQNRVLIKNCHGDFEYFHFQDRHFQRIKVDDEHWKLVLVP